MARGMWQHRLFHFSGRQALTAVCEGGTEVLTGKGLEIASSEVASLRHAGRGLFVSLNLINIQEQTGSMVRLAAPALSLRLR